MAKAPETTEEKERRLTKKKEKEIIDLAMKRLKIAVDADDHNRTAAIEDLKFANGEQWDGKEKKRRADKGRPALTLNLLPKFIDQVVGDMLHNTPSVKVRPVDSKADINIAKIRQGIISNVEYQSNSKGIYGYAGKQQVTCGYGAWRVLSRYTEENPFLQEIYLEGIRNPFLMYMDPSAKDQNYADAKWGFLLEKMSRDDFEERYPKAVTPSTGMKTGKGLSDELWYDDDTITVAEYFIKDTETVKMLQLKDGRVMTEEEFKKTKDDWDERYEKLLANIAKGPQAPPQGGPPPPMPGPPPNAPAAPVGMAAPPGLGAQKPPSPPNGAMQPAAPAMKPPMPQGPPGAPPMGGPPPGMPQPDPLAMEMKKLGDEPTVAKKKDTEVTRIRHYIVTCMEILSGGVDGKLFPGKFIPLVLLKGKELNIEGKNYVYSLIRHAKDPQKLINYWNTAAAETIALAPKAPWLATPKQIEGHETAFAAANVENFPVLLYNVDPEAPGAPQRVSASQPPVAIFEQIRRGEENLKSVIGMFNADVGAPGSEQTGAAINARQRPGDIATFEFMENLARAVNYTGRVINEMIPEIYDTERDVRVRNLDDTESFVPVNTTLDHAMKAVSENPEAFAGIDIGKLRTMFSKDGKDAKYNDITAGKYDIVVTTGPSYATQRQESAQHLMQLAQSMPQQMALASDLIVENMDFKGADELAARLRKSLPPNVVKPRAGEPPPQPQQPPPQVLLAQAKLESEKIKAGIAQAKLKNEEAKAQRAAQPTPPEPPDQTKLAMEKMKIEMEQLRNQTEKARMAAEAQAAQFRAQLEQEKLMFEQKKQALALQFQREAHHARMSEIEAQTEMARMNRKEPKRKE